MPSGVEPLDGAQAGKQLVTLAADAREISVISPFISDAGASMLLDALQGRRRLQLRILTRAEPHDVMQDVMSAHALERLMAFGTAGGRTVEIRRESHVHAKLYLFDARTAIVGSANLTKPGLTGENIELCCLVTKRAIVQDLRDRYFRPWFDSATPIARDYVALLRNFEAQHAGLKHTLQNVRSFGELCSVRTVRTEGDYFNSVGRLLDVLQKPCAPARISKMLRDGHEKALHRDGEEAGRFNASKRIAMLKLLGLIVQRDDTLQRGPFADEVAATAGRLRLWDRMRLAYPELETMLRCFQDHETMTYRDLAKTLNWAEMDRRLRPGANWLVALGHLNRSEGTPAVFSRRVARQARTAKARSRSSLER